MRKVIWTGLAVVTALGVGAGAAVAQSTAAQKGDRIRARIEQRVQARMAQIDRNHDGVIGRDEWPGNPKRFDRIDRNHDGTLTQDEVARAMIARRLLARRLARRLAIK